MKKRLALLVIASILFFLGASPWEGSAVVAPNGELPSTGYYIATNAFPRNTVVDVTNIETSKSVRVIVSNSLSNPGLLAVVSREAAQIIGMRAGSVTRIRMIQPSDPMAYMRFTESMTAGVPEYDSGNVINEDNLTADVYGDDSYKPPNADNIPETQLVTPIMPGYIVDEPEWGGNGKLQIVDVPGFMVDSGEPEEQPSVAQVTPNNEIKQNGEPEIESGIIEQPKKDFEKDVPTRTDERPPTGIEKDAPGFIAEAPRNDVIKDVSPWQEAVVVTVPEPVEVVEESEPEPEPVEVVEEPEPEPVEIVEEPEPEPEPVEVVEEPEPEPVEVVEEPEPEPVEIVEEPEPEPVEVVKEPVKEETTVTQAPPEQTVLVPRETDLNPPRMIVAIPNEPAAAANETRIPPAETNFSVRTINSLDRGKYYVQVAAQPDNLVENTLNQIDRSFAPVVFRGTDNLCRILIGPLNQGESAAVLARVKSIGYKDAFVRRGG